jgi:hypothetical protein
MRQFISTIEEKLGKPIEQIRQEPLPHRTNQEALEVPSNDNYLTHSQIEEMFCYALR